MLPEILGCYQSSKQQRMGGAGSAGRGFTQRIEWLALRQGTDRILLFPLDDNKLPLPLPKPVSHREFLEHFLPEPLLYNERLAPAALVLARLLGDVGDRLDQAALPEAEGALYAVVLAALGASGHKDPTGAARAVLEAAGAAKARGDVQKQTINAFGIHLRKSKDFDTAIAYYQKALELAPDDERLLFNLARALFEKGDFEGCRTSLEAAIAREPEFPEARKFLRYLERRRQPLPDDDFPDIPT